MGTVTDIDSAGTIFVDWDSGSTLGLVYGVDSYRRAVEPIYENAAEFWGHLKEVNVNLNAALAVGGKYIGTKATTECTANEKEFCRELFALMNKTICSKPYWNPVRVLFPLRLPMVNRRTRLGLPLRNRSGLRPKLLREVNA